MLVLYVAEGLIGTATINKNGLLPSLNAYYSYFDQLKIATLNKNSCACFFINSNNTYSQGFLLYVEAVQYSSGSKYLTMKKLFDVGVADSVKIGYRAEGDLMAVYISRVNVIMNIQCISIRGDVNLIYTSEEYPDDCISATLIN